MKTLFYKFLRNFVNSFAGYNWLWHLLAIALTYIIVVSGFDWRYFVATRDFVPWAVLYPALIGGMIFPIIVPLVLLGIGKIKHSAKTTLTAWAMGQAALLAWVISVIYKFFTGRLHPETSNSTLIDISHGFRLGFGRGGIFWGWPSSHTIVAFAVSITLIVLFPKSKIVKLLLLLYAFYVGLSVSISVHWFSEFVAGAIMGTVIGLVVGRAFKEKQPA